MVAPPGGLLGDQATDRVVEAYIRRARAARTYLQRGDRVTIHVDRLGVVENEIEAARRGDA